MKLSITLAVLLSSLQVVHAWGTLGHQTVAYIASDLVRNTTRATTQALLSDISSDYLAGIATWADTFRSTAAGAFSAPLHYIDAQDNPPETCEVDFDRDCGEEGCIVSAIANYTTRLTSSSSSSATKAEALKFLIHFIGDVHQPLHVENIERGGNGINVIFDGANTNLHSVWDSSIIQKAHGTGTLANSRKLATLLGARIKTGGAYANQVGEWEKGLDKTDGKASSLIWAGDANSYVCTVVLPEGREGVEGEELSEGAYYDNALSAAETLLAKGGVRLAAWLDLLVGGAPSTRYATRWRA